MGEYYGSDLNRFLGEYCPKEFTVINIDCLELKWETKELRIIESKHQFEPIGNQQLKALKFLADRLSELTYQTWTFNVYLARGNFPYENLIVEDLSRGRKWRIAGQNNIKDWLSFKTALEDIAEEITLTEHSTYTKLPI